MIAPIDDARRYRIIVRGDCEELLTGVIDGLMIELCQGWTCAVASVRDEAELHGLLDRFRDLALHITSLRELGVDLPPGQFGE